MATIGTVDFYSYSSPQLHISIICKQYVFYKVQQDVTSNGATSHFGFFPAGNTVLQLLELLAAQKSPTHSISSDSTYLQNDHKESSILASLVKKKHI